MPLFYASHRQPASLARTAGVVTILLLVTSFEARSLPSVSGNSALVLDAVRGLLFGFLLGIGITAFTGWLRIRKHRPPLQPSQPKERP